MTPDELNDSLRERVGSELPTPPNGFESDAEADAHRRAHDARFFELCQQEPTL